MMPVWRRMKRALRDIFSYSSMVSSACDMGGILPLTAVEYHPQYTAEEVASYIMAGEEKKVHFFKGPRFTQFLGNLNAFKEANSAKLVVQVSIGEGRGT